MSAVEHLVKLYKLSDEYGEITAFDSYGPDVFVGTSHGYLLHLLIEGLPTESAAPTRLDLNGNTGGDDMSVNSAVSLFTSLAGSVQIKPRTAVRQVQHSRVHRLVLVCCGAVLTARHSDTLETLYQISADAALFFLAPASQRTLVPSTVTSAGDSVTSLPDTQDPLGGGAGAGGGGAVPLHSRTVSTTSDAAADGSFAEATPADRPASAPPHEAASRLPSLLSSRSSRVPWREASAAASRTLASAPERVFVVPRSNPKLINVTELRIPTSSDTAAAASTNTSATAVAPLTFVLPEPIIALFAYKDALCVRTRRQCSVLSLRTGTSRQVGRFQSDDNATHPAMTVCADTGELCIAHRQTVLRGVDLGSANTAAAGGSTNTGGESGVRGAPVTEERRAMLRGCFECAEPVRVLVVRHPYLFAFSDRACDVLSHFDSEAGAPAASSSTETAAPTALGAVERLAIPGILFSSPLARGDCVFLASRDTVWMMSLYPLRYQLAQLVHRGAIEEAFQVLQRRRRRVPAADLESVELELHILAGFTYLRQASPRQALRHLAHRIDPRDVLLHMPDCIPSPHLSAEVRRLCALPPPPQVPSYSQAHDKHLASQAERSDEENGGGYWDDWHGACPYNTPAGQLQTEWLRYFEHSPTAPVSTVTNTVSLQTSSGSLVRVVHGRGPMTAAVFLETTWEWFKDATVLYLRSRLVDEGDVLSRAQRRSVSYALLVLMLERQDHHGAYQVVAHDPHLALVDVYDLLVALREYRLLALVLHRKGLLCEAQHILRTFVYTSSFLSPSEPLPPLRAGAPLEAYAMDCWRACGGANAGMAFKHLPQAVRWSLQRQLGIGGDDETPSDTAHASERPSSLSSQSEAVRWAALVKWYQEALVALVTRHGHVLPAAHDGVSFLLLNDCAPVSCSSPSATAVPEQPGSLSEAFYLVDHMNLAALQQLLETQPALVTVRDEEGCTLLHAVLSLLVLAQPPRSEARAADHTSQMQSSMLQAVLGATALLVDYGCPVNAVNLRAQTALDVVAEATCSGGTGCLDVVTASLVAMTRINTVALDAVRAATAAAGGGGAR